MATEQEVRQLGNQVVTVRNNLDRTLNQLVRDLRSAMNGIQDAMFDQKMNNTIVMIEKTRSEGMMRLVETENFINKQLQSSLQQMEEMAQDLSGRMSSAVQNFTWD